MPHRIKHMNEIIILAVDRICKIIQIPFIIICMVNTGNARQWLDDVTTQECGSQWLVSNVLSTYQYYFD